MSYNTKDVPVSFLSSIATVFKPYQKFLQTLILITVGFLFGPLMGLAVGMATRWLGMLAGVDPLGLDGHNFREFIIGSSVVTTLGAWLVAGMGLSDTMR